MVRSPRMVITNSTTRDNFTQRASAFFLFFLIFVASIALVLSAKGFQSRLKDIREARSDNAGWVVAQLALDHRNLNLALDAGSIKFLSEELDELNGKAFARITRQFDIFYSRVDVFVTTLERLQIHDQTKQILSDLEAIRDRLAMQVDAIEVPNSKEILAIQKAVEESYPLVREASVRGLQELTLDTERATQEEERLFMRFYAQSVVLLALMGLCGFLSIMLWRQLERRVAESEWSTAMLYTAFNSTLNGVIVFDIEYRVIYSNDRANKLLGRDADKIKTLTLDEIFTPCDPKEEGERVCHIREIVDSKRPKQFLCLSSDGKHKHVEVSLVEDVDLSGQKILIGFIRDISGQVRAESALRSALKAAHQAAEAKSMFLATMSHEMRTPLHGLKAALELLGQSELTDSDKALLGTAHDCCSRAIAQVDDVLELTRIGQSNEQAQPFDPIAIATSIVEELNPLANKSRTTIKMNVTGAPQKARYNGYPIAFSRSIYNLAGNAVKFTQEGTISVHLRIVTTEQEEHHLYVEIADTGIGISEADQRRIFDTFETVNSEVTAPYSGTGLGLPIARSAVERQGGVLEVESELGIGSCFRFDIHLGAIVELPELESKILPAPPSDGAEETDPSKSQAVNFQNKRVLVVDDNETNRTLMVEMVRRLGFFTETALNGQDAVVQATETSFDIILMDFAMPVMDGPTAARCIRSTRGASQGSVILGITALLESAIKREQTADMDAILTKPLDLERLRNAIVNSSYTGATADLQKEVVSLSEVCNLVGATTCTRLARVTLEEIQAALEALHDPDFAAEEKATILHRAAGSTGFLGMVEMSRTFAEFEQKVRNGANRMTPRTLAELDLKVKHVTTKLKTEISNLEANCENAKRGQPLH